MRLPPSPGCSWFDGQDLCEDVRRATVRANTAPSPKPQPQPHERPEQHPARQRPCCGRSHERFCRGQEEGCGDTAKEWKCEELGQCPEQWRRRSFGKRFWGSYSNIQVYRVYSSLFSIRRSLFLMSVCERFSICVHSSSYRELHISAVRPSTVRLRKNKSNHEPHGCISCL